MASACVKNTGISSDTFLDFPPAKFPLYGRLSPRKSLIKGEYLEQKDSEPQPEKNKPPAAEKMEEPDREDDTKDLGDFEFMLEDNFTMLTADELFLDGKLMPLRFNVTEASLKKSPSIEITSPYKAKLSKNEIAVMDPYLFSPKAPRCTASWKELLGLRKLYQKENENNQNSKSIKSLIYRSSKLSMSSPFDGSVNQPLLKHSDNEYISISSGHKLSSVKLPRVSVHGPACANSRRATSSLENHTMRRKPYKNAVARGIMESPRMNASGKIVYNSLERSSSSPSSYGGPRCRHSSVQRSYSANVRVTPVLNVPVCSLRGSSLSKSGGVFGLFGSSAQPKRDSFGNGTTNSKGSVRKDRN